MIFSNSEIGIGDLPNAADVEYQSLDKRYQSLLIVEGLIGFILVTLLIIIAYFSNDLLHRVEFILLLVSGWVLISFILLWMGFSSWKYKGYALREKDIMYKTGIWFRKNVVIAFHRVQHIEIHQGPLERLFGINSMTLFTAGGSNSDLTIPGMNPEVAAKIKDWIMKTGSLDEEE